MKRLLQSLKWILEDHPEKSEIWASDILLAVLRSKEDSSFSDDDLLEIAFDIDSVLYAFEKNVSPRRVAEAIISVLAHQVGHRVCFDMLARLVDNDTPLYGEDLSSGEWKRVLGYIVKVS